MNFSHKDCRNYLAVDVFKGLCKLDKENINADDASCKRFDLLEKCRYCSNYTNVEEQMGLCMNKIDAYPEMVAKTCEDFKWKNKH